MAHPVDFIREYDGPPVQLSIRQLDDETVLIEADRNSLEFLSRLLHAQAQSDDCGLQFGPSGPGSAWFKDSATLGLYVHRLPCDHTQSSSTE